MYVKLGNYKFKYSKPSWPNNNLKIYESHVGMCGIEARLHSYRDFKDTVLPMV
jgi:1,4-alpha-glucan branching enzyme